MGMTDKQFNAFLRQLLAELERVLIECPESKEVKKLIAMYQSMLED